MERIRNQIPERSSEISLHFSEKMGEIITKASASLPEGGVLSSVDLLWEIANGETQGGKILKVVGAGWDRYPRFLQILQPSRTGDWPVAVGKFTFEGREILYGQSVVKLWERAEELADQMPINTADIVLAEVGLVDSFLVHAFRQVGVPTSIPDDITAQQLSSVRRETGLFELKLSPFFQEEIESVTPAVAQPIERVDFLPKSGIVDLIAEAREGKFANLVIRPKWVTELLSCVETQPLSVLVCGRSDAEAIVCGLADQLAKDTTRSFGYQKLVMINPEVIETNSLSAITSALVTAQNGILYLPDIHRYLKSGSQESLYLRRALASRKVKIVSCISEGQWKASRQEDIFRELRPIFPEMPSIPEAVAMIRGKRGDLEASLRAGEKSFEITEEAIEAACKFGHRYLRDTFPTSAVNLLLRAGTEARIGASSMDAIRDKRIKSDTEIDPEDVIVALEKMTGIKVTVEDPQRLLNMEMVLQERIVNQDKAIEAVSDAIRKARAGLNDPNRPLGSFMFMGPSGVGKTELAKALAEFLFGNEREMVVLDMSEYGERQNVARLIGSPPGYVGYEEGGQLTEAIKKKPYSVVVLDEIDKAHPEVLNVLLQILEEGRLTDGQGKTIDFTQTVVIMTGNVGSKYFMAEEEVGREKVVAAVDEEIRDAFRLEFLNRIDDIMIFNTLKPEHLLPIVDIQMKRVNQRLEERQISLALSEEVKKYLAEKGYDPVYGARPLRREIDKLSSQLAIEILARKYSSGDKIRAELIDGNIVFNKIEKPAGQ